MSHRFDWLAEYLHETTDFPEGKHDDQADSTAQFLDWFKTPIACWGIYETTRRKAVKAPAGIGAVQTFSNRHLTVGLDGIVEMSAEDAEYLIPAGWIELPDGTAT